MMIATCDVRRATCDAQILGNLFPASLLLSCVHSNCGSRSPVTRWKQGWECDSVLRLDI